jgi:hypothetical protein
MYKNPVIYIDVFLKDQACIDIFKKNLVQFKKLSLPIFIVTNKEFPENIQNDVNHVFYDFNNIFFTKKYDSYETLVHWSSDTNGKISLQDKYCQLYGLSVLSNLYKGAHIIKTIGYDSFIKLEWDYYIGDSDIDLIKKFIDDFKNENYKGKFLSHPNHLLDKTHHVFSAMVSAVDVDYFILKFPKILNEDDYERYIIQKFKNRDFKTVDRLLYYVLVYENMTDVIVDDSNKFESQLKNSIGNIHISDVNWSNVFAKTETSKHVFANFENEPGNYIFYSHNISYVNPENPNFESIRYDVTTKKRNFSINHTVNTGCWSYNTCTFDDDEFPIKIKCNQKEISYESKNDINVYFTKF